MAGERLSRLELRVTSVSLNETIRIWLGGAYYDFVPVNTAPYPINCFYLSARNGGAGPAEDYLYNVSQTGAGLANAIRAVATTIDQAGLGRYTVRDRLVSGENAPPPYTYREIIIEAVVLSAGFDFNACQFPNGPGVGTYNPAYFTAIVPVQVSVATTPAGIYGTATGSITLTASNGTTGNYTYAWDDDPTATGRVRQNVRAGVYRCTVTDASGASTVVTATVIESPQLRVAVSRRGSSLLATVTGGIAPYQYLWTGGSTLPQLDGVEPGLPYQLLVQDAQGDTLTVTFYAEGLRYWFSGNPIDLALDAGPAYRADPTTKPGLAFGCEVFVEREYLSEVFERVGPALEQPADADGTTTFHVQELLEPFVGAYLPAVNQTFVVRTDVAFCRFYLQHYEITDAGRSPLSFLDYAYLVRGGLSYVEAIAPEHWFNSQRTSPIPFLTWEPNGKLVLPDQPEYLYYQVPAPISAVLRYLVHVFFDDGTDTEFEQATVNNVRGYEIHCLPAGFRELQLGALENNVRVVRWECWLLDFLRQPISEVRTFYVDRRPAPTRRYFQYPNSLGGTNTLVCRGSAQRTLATKTSTADRATADLATGTDLVVLDRTGQPTLKCYTGPRGAVQLLADRDFLLSRQAWLLHEGRWLGGLVKDRTYTDFDEDETRRVLEFDFQLPTERFYTPRLA